ncbi:hypothetical protein GGI21_006010 [Coemansia aciculifera]|uniref:Uncharacterized protein n=1 Tax=Coemansia aciculifera TaxID=417176 RepID=A0ACC1LVW8_9FUNG|nr:hypothetical protein IWW38_005397 [Coemansia aciculifera]KAJ2890921.1 hypothetical protein GGI21_006010 [Coemansia aciculifera]
MFGKEWWSQQKPRVSPEQIKSLEDASDVLVSGFICLSRIREPLALVGGYWGMDPQIIFQVSAGSPRTAIYGILGMCKSLAKVRGSPELSSETNRLIGLFIERANVWVRINQI